MTAPKLSVFGALLMAAGLALAAQAPPPAATPQPLADPNVLGGDENMLDEGELLYRHAEERDPFSPLVRSSQTSDVKVKVGSTGLARYTVESCQMEAIVKTSAGTVAWFQGPDNKPYKAVVGEKFADGVIVEISMKSGEVVVQQELNDPTAIKPYRNLTLKIRNDGGEAQ